MAIINFENFRTQYFLVFTGLNMLKLIGVVDKAISLIGGTFMLTTLAWNLTKYVRTYFNREFIPTLKKAVLITGAESGLTNDLAVKLNEHGYRVYATVLEKKQEVVDSLVNNSRFEDLMSVRKMDVTNENEVNQLAQEITTELDNNGEQLWAVINGAEVIELGHFDWSQFKMYENIFDVNTLGTVRVVRAFLPLIRKSKGRIINIESIASRLTLPKFTAYSMSKHANIAFSDALRRELHDSGIKVSTIEMGYGREPAKPSEQLDKFNRSIREQWDKTSETVKKLYGSEYLNELKIERLAEMFPNNIDTALEDLLDAIRGQEPQIRYTPYNSFKGRLFSHIVEALPIEWLDNYYFSTEKDTPNRNPVCDKPQEQGPEEIPKAKSGDTKERLELTAENDETFNEDLMQ